MALFGRILGRLVLAPFLSLTAEAAIAETSSLERTYLERAAITAADLRCDLFSEGERYALKTGLYQARGELLRHNYAPEKIQQAADDVAANARSLGCGHPSVAEVAARVRDSYRQFAKTTFLEFPALHATWEASRSPHDAWAVRQTDAESGAILGVRRRPTGDEKELQLAFAMPMKGPPPSAARIFIRDTDRVEQPWLGGFSGVSDRLVAPPRAITRTEWAGDLLRFTDNTRQPFYVFYFSAATLARIEALDPREAVQVETTPDPRAGGEVQTWLFEAGDLAAADAFVRIPAPEAASTTTAAPVQTASAH
ncbi:MAG: hypothetical protein R3C52_15045 [Hyphomonadaceae bacterium]